MTGLGSFRASSLRDHPCGIILNLEFLDSVLFHTDDHATTIILLLLYYYSSLNPGADRV